MNQKLYDVELIISDRGKYDTDICIIKANNLDHAKDILYNHYKKHYGHKYTESWLWKQVNDSEFEEVKGEIFISRIAQ